MSLVKISDVMFAAAKGRDFKRGLLGWISCTLNGAFRLDGITLRRTRSGRLVVSFPARKDRHGRLHAVLRPLGDRTRCQVEEQIIAALDMEGVIP